MERLLQDAEKLSGKDFDISSYSDIIDAIHIIQTEMGITGTTMEESEKTIEGSIHSMKGAWENWLTALAGGTGSPVETASELVDSVIKVAENIVPRVGAILSNLGNVIAPLIPQLASRLGNGILDTFPSAIGNPIREAFSSAMDFIAPIVGSFSHKFLPALDILGTTISGLLENVAPVIEIIASTVGPVVQDIILKVIDLASALMVQIAPAVHQIGAIVQAVLPVIQTQFTAAMTIIQGVVNAVWPFIQAIITTAMNVIRNVISIVLAAVQGNWSGVWNGIKALVSSVWSGIKSIVSAGINAAKGVISSVLAGIKTMWRAGWSNIKSAVSTAWTNIKTAVSDGIDGVSTTISELPGKITGYFTDAGTWLYESGKSVINGFLNGITSIDISGKISGVLEKIRAYFPFSPAKKGPFSGRGWVLYSGQSIMEAMAKGALSREGLLTNTFSGIMGNANNALTLGYTPINASTSESPMHSLAYEVRALHEDLGNIIYANTPTESTRSFNRRVTYA